MESLEERLAVKLTKVEMYVNNYLSLQHKPFTSMTKNSPTTHPWGNLTFLKFLLTSQGQKRIKTLCVLLHSVKVLLE